MIKRLFLVGLLCLFSALLKPVYAQNLTCDQAQEALENGDIDLDEYEDMYPYCSGDANIDMPLDNGVPFLLVAAALFGAIKIYKSQNESREDGKLSR